MQQSFVLGVIALVVFLAGAMFVMDDAGQEYAAYVIRRVGPEMKVDGNINKEQWQQAKAIDIKKNTFGEKKEYQSPTVAKAVYNDEGLFLLFVSQDEHIVANHTKLNSEVSRDDCVELFAMPQPSKNNDYFNLEINCVGTVLMHFGPEALNSKEYEARKKISRKQVGSLEIYRSVTGRTKKPRLDDKQWIIEYKIPFALLKEFAGIDRVQSGDVWRINLYRCGSLVDEVHASWQRVPREGRGFHQPRFFAPVRFE